MSVSEIVVSAVVFRDPQGRVLTVRKSGTDKFMFPGGKHEPGESAIDAAVREVGEELAIQVRAENLHLVGTFSSDAANEPGHSVTATVYEHAYVPVADPAAEIAELRWEDLSSDPADDLAPLLAHSVFPVLRDERRVVGSGVSPGLRAHPATVPSGRLPARSDELGPGNRPEWSLTDRYGRSTR